MARWFLVLGAASGLLSVVLGAFGAHALKARLPPDLLATFEIGVRYQMYHALGLLLLGLFTQTRPSGAAHAAGACFLFGTLVFSGSLYLLAASGQRWLGAVTPFGGLGFIVGWGLFAYAAFRA